MIGEKFTDERGREWRCIAAGIGVVILQAVDDAGQTAQVDEARLGEKYRPGGKT